MVVVKGNRQQWRVGNLMDSGGFGDIYYAQDDRNVVIKLVPKVPGAEREYLIDDLSGVRNVIPLLDRGETEDRWALVMPRAEKSLRKFLLDRSGQSLDPMPALGIMIEIAQALVDLDAKKVVHRDLKPENVLLFNGRWCLTDFGISRYAAAATAPDTRKYAMSDWYAAPEQWRFQRATSATDVYALGVIGYELLAGRRPFLGPDYREQHLVGQPSALPPSVPTPLAALVEQCLLKSPGSRPTPSDLLGRLQRQASTAPVSGGLAALQEANRAGVARLVGEARLASEAQNEAERREALRLDAWRQMRSIATTLLEGLRSAASAGVVTPYAQANGGHFQLVEAGLNLSPLREVKDATDVSSLPFDVIAWSHLDVGRPRDRTGYEGRSHSLWFCDAQQQGQYRWYETAFMDQPLRRAPSRALDPFAADPRLAEAHQALGRGIGMYQVAWPFTAVWAAALIPDSRLRRFLRCDLPVQVFVVDLYRDPIPEP